MATRRRLRVKRDLEDRELEELLEQKEKEQDGEKPAADEAKETPGPLKQIDDLGRLGVQQRADAMNGLQKRVGNQALVNELEFERDVFPRAYLQHRHQLKAELLLRLKISERLPVVGELPEDWKKQLAQRPERAWWDCLTPEGKGDDRRDVVSLEEALREIAAFQQLGMPCPPFVALLERERRRYLEGKRLSPV